MKIEKLRIPFQGSKQAIAEKLLLEMLKYKPRAKYFVDLFGGGGAMSFTALQMNLNVTYNEINTNLVNFLKFTLDRIIKNEKGKYGLFPDEFYEFVTREKYDILRTQNGIYPEFVRICYSFGNSRQKIPNYAFNRDLEKKKYLLHDIVINNDELALFQFNLENNTNLTLSNKQTWNERRLEVMRYCKLQRLEQLERLQQLQQLERLQQLQESERLEQLEQLQQLERLQQLESQSLDAFIITNLDFQEVKIKTPIEETIVYLDPPYIKTARYGEEFNHLELYEYLKNSKYDCFLSEYASPFVSIFEISKRKNFNIKNQKEQKVTEKLFINI